MFFKIVFCVWILIKFDQNPANHVKKISQATPVRDVQNRIGKFHKSGT
jgi:hypothetical protein